MNYSQRFERDYQWYLSVSNVFSFDGKANYVNAKGEEIIVLDNKGMSAKECFYLFDSQGIISPTTQTEALKTLYKTKGSVNLHIKMYAEDRARGYLPKVEFEKLCKEIKAPDWFIKAVEKQKTKYYEQQIK